VTVRVVDKHLSEERPEQGVGLLLGAFGTQTREPDPLRRSLASVFPDRVPRTTENALAWLFDVAGPVLVTGRNFAAQPLVAIPFQSSPDQPEPGCESLRTERPHLDAFLLCLGIASSKSSRA